MYSKEFALKIKEKVDKEKVIVVSDEADLILGYRIVKYYYSNEETKKKHADKIEKDGYQLSDEGFETLHCDLFKLDECVRVLMGEYEKACYQGIK